MRDRNVCVINFVREEDGLFVNGTLSTLDGTPRASWTFKQDGTEFTQQIDVDEEDFTALWDGFPWPAGSPREPRSRSGCVKPWTPWGILDTLAFSDQKRRFSTSQWAGFASIR
jgi:hypothetical protein